MSKTAEDYFKERFSKHEQKIQRFDYYDMVDFADQYAQQRVSELERTVRNLEVDCESYKLTIDMEMERVKELEKENDELKMRIISQMIILSNFQNGLSRDLGINPVPSFYSDAERHVKQLEQSNKELVEALKYCANKAYILVNTKDAVRKDCYSDVLKLNKVITETLSKFKEVVPDNKTVI